MSVACFASQLSSGPEQVPTASTLSRCALTSSMPDAHDYHFGARALAIRSVLRRCLSTAKLATKGTVTPNCTASQASIWFMTMFGISPESTRSSKGGELLKQG